MCRDAEPAVNSQIGYGEEGLRARSLSNASQAEVATARSSWLCCTSHRTHAAFGHCRAQAGAPPRTRSRSRSRARTRSRGPSGGTRMRTKSQIANEAGNIIEVSWVLCSGRACRYCCGSCGVAVLGCGGVRFTGGGERGGRCGAGRVLAPLQDDGRCSHAAAADVLRRPYTAQHRRRRL